MKSNAFTLAVALSLLTSFLPALALPQSPSSVRPSSKPRNGMTWTLYMSNELTVFDSIWVSSSIVNSSTQRFTFHTDAETNIVKFILTPQDKAAIVRTINVSRPPTSILQYQSGNYKPKPKEVVASFRIDLRKLFGRLPAGEYSIAIHYPSTSYVVKNLAAYEPNDLQSPVISFRIHNTSLAEATRHDKGPVEVQFVLDKSVKGKVATTATITNKTNVTLRFPAYMNFAKHGKSHFKPPLSTLMRNQKWHPKSGWTSRTFGFCGTGLGLYVLEKGESVKVMLNLPLELDGLYRYELSYSGPKKGPARTAFSKPFVIRTFKTRVKSSSTK